MPGQKRKFEKLYNRHADKIYSLAWRLSSYNEFDARDLTQETFLRALKGYEKYKDKDAEFAWLRKICVNIVREKWRKAQYFNAYNRSIQNDTWMSDPIPSPDATVESNEALKLILDTLNTIKPEYREVIILKHFARLNDDEIASLQQIETATVRSRIRRARVELAGIISRRNKEVS